MSGDPCRDDSRIARQGNLPQSYLAHTMEASQIEQRRWTRLNPEILMPCRVRLLDLDVATELRDLSPGGIGLALPPGSILPYGELLRVRIAFRGQPAVVRDGIVSRFEPVSGNLGLAWPFLPSPWTELERRSRQRVHLPQDTLFGRIPLRHAHRVWSRFRIVDLTSDLGFQLETVGGPGYLLPGHVGAFQLDLPLLSGRQWDAQVIWCRPGQGQAMRMGIRVLDPDPDLSTALGEWLELDRMRSPLALQELGFRKAPLPGQFRFRKVEESGERRDLNEFLALPRDGAGIPLGVWDGPLLVAGAYLRMEDHTGRRCRVDALRLRREWVVPDVFLGLWEQIVRHFLSTGAEVLHVPCPPGRERLFTMAGLQRPTEHNPDWSIPRGAILWGRGVPLAHWHLLYSEIGAFSLQKRGRKVRWIDRTLRTARKLGWMILRDWLDPRTRARFHREVDLWARDAT